MDTLITNPYYIIVYSMLIFWDAQRLVREYVFLAAWDFRRKPMKDLVWSDQIFFQRLIAVIHAYVGDVIPHTDIPYDHTSAVFGQGGRYDLEVLPPH